MKKIISLGLASAVCAITAVAASAAPASYVVNGDVVEGGAITIDILAGEDVSNIEFDVVAEGLEIQGVECPSNDSLIDKYSNGHYVLVGGSSVVLAGAGDVLCTITATVTAKAGEEVSLSLSDANGRYTALLPEAGYTATVAGKTSTPGSSDPGSEPGTSDPGSEPSGGDDIPETGVALAVVPAVLAAAGIVVAKKRK